MKITDLDSVTFVPSVKHVAILRVGPSFSVYVGTVPNRFHRFMTRVLLGWHWDVLPTKAESMNR